MNFVKSTIGLHMKNLKLIKVIFALVICASSAAQNSLVNTSQSRFAKLQSPGMADVKWTTGFWADRFEVCKKVMVPQLWHTYTSDTICYSFQNFKIAASLQKGDFRGPSFHDGDFYKSLEAVASLYAVTGDAQLMQWMDNAIAVIGKAQRKDGYIYTRNIIEQKQTGESKMFDDKLSFEAYNFGHLMTAGCVHFRATGKNDLLSIAEKAADFLIGFYNQATPEQARNAICPSHYMGLAELFRTTNHQKYLDLLKKLIDIRGTVEGTDDNSDRAPFRDMKKIVGHAVRANYLMAGVADLYAETGDQSLWTTLDTLWKNVVQTKMYVTGGCGALYDGVSVDGTSYRPDTVQKVHQSYGRDYQLPNFSAHNETCANIGNVLWNYRMFLLTGEEKYFNIVELALYNSVLSGVSLDGSGYFYTNPLAHSTQYPYHLRWEGGRVPYIGLSNCCPPNTVRSIAQVNNYMYSLSAEGLYLNMYGGSTLNTKTSHGQKISLQQISNYPWDGLVKVNVQEVPKEKYALHFRIPSWCKSAGIQVNGHLVKNRIGGGRYFTISKKWKKGDQIELRLDMPVTLIVSNPMVEETRNQVVVKRGPLVYCVEANDVKGVPIFDIALPIDIQLKPVYTRISGENIMALKGIARLINDGDWSRTLYKEVSRKQETTSIQLIPYFAWANRGDFDMSVWLPLER